jgi:hypothetical protein
LHDKKKKACLLTDGTIPVGSIFNIKENGKQSKYKYLEIELNRMWKERTKFVPVVIGALGTLRRDEIRTVSCSQVTYWSAIELQKITLMSTTHNIL